MVLLLVQHNFEAEMAMVKFENTRENPFSLVFGVFYSFIGTYYVKNTPLMCPLKTRNVP